jgi:fructose-bisphosphate aldolase class II
MAAMTEVCVQRYESFNTSGQASKLKPVSLVDMAASYTG